jgi:hypothetical protein
MNVKSLFFYGINNKRAVINIFYIDEEQHEKNKAVLW